MMRPDTPFVPLPEPELTALKGEATAWFTTLRDRIVAALEAGTLPWRWPWTADGPATLPGAPCNAVNGRPYRGVNAVLLAMTGFARGGDDPR